MLFSKLTRSNQLILTKHGVIPVFMSERFCAPGSLLFEKAASTVWWFCRWRWQVFLVSWLWNSQLLRPTRQKTGIAIYGKVVYTCTYACTCIYVCIHVCVYMHTGMYAYMYDVSYTFVCLYESMYVQCICIYVLVIYLLFPHKAINLHTVLVNMR